VRLASIFVRGSRDAQRPSISEPTTRPATPSAQRQPPAHSHEQQFGEADDVPLISEDEADISGPVSSSSGEDEADGSGIGMPDGDARPGEDNDEIDPEEEPLESELDGAMQEALEGTPVPGQGSQRRFRPLADWISARFEALVAESKNRDSRGLPPLYAKHKTFRFPRKANWFLLQSSTPTPHDLYDVEWFLWDPLALCTIPCPNCRAELRRHTNISRPRRCVGLNSTIFIIGYRYVCNPCSRVKLPGQNTTFRSWDSRILASLPPALAAEFPARLSHRSALESSTFELMRSCFQNGMGSKQFSDVLRVQHLLRYDKIQLQYLQHISSRPLDLWNGQTYLSFLPFDDRSSRGLHGYVPSGQYLRDLYDRYIEQHGHYFDRHTSLLPANVCALDHSHKVTRQPISRT
jgi:hypothetical protein